MPKLGARCKFDLVGKCWRIFANTEHIWLGPLEEHFAKCGWVSFQIKLERERTKHIITRFRQKKLRENLVIIYVLGHKLFSQKLLLSYIKHSALAIMNKYDSSSSTILQSRIAQLLYIASGTDHYLQVKRKKCFNLSINDVIFAFAYSQLNQRKVYNTNHQQNASTIYCCVK